MKAIFTLVLVMLSTTAISASIVIDGTNLSAPRDNMVQYNIIGDGQTKWLRGYSESELNDGSYTLRVGTYIVGSFIVSNGLIAESSGSIIRTGNTINFNLETMTKVDFDLSSASVGGKINYHINSAEVFATGKITIYLPDGVYDVSTNASEGGTYGSFTTNNGAVSASGHLYTDGLNVLPNINSLAPIRVNISPLAQDPFNRAALLINLGGAMWNINDDKIAYLPDGKYSVATRYYGTSYGNVNISNSASQVYADGYMTSTFGVDSVYNIDFDLSTTPKATIDFTQLSSPAGPMRGQIYQLGWGTGTTDFYLPPGTYNVWLSPHGAYASLSSGYGSFTLDSSGFISSQTGILTVQSNTIGFNQCGVTALVVEPLKGTVDYILTTAERDRRIGVASYFLADGEYTLGVRDVDPFAQGAIRFKLSSQDGVQIVQEDLTGLVSLSTNPSFCAPPDSDLDSIIDELDMCPDTPISDPVDSDGCSVMQSVALQCGAWKSRNHGKYVSCSTHLLNDMKANGFIDNKEKGEFMKLIAR